MEEKKDSFTSLKDIISGMLNDPSLPFNPADARIWEVWDKAVGPGISKHARPSWIRKGLLRVEVSDPIWLQELEFSAETIKEKLNEQLGVKTIKKIEFRLNSG
jgi:predicted nucleic acid-binding Zn ribbon protein